MKLLLDQFPALGTLWWIEVDEHISHAHEQILKASVIEMIHDFERTYTRFKESSLLSQLNREKILQDAPDEFIDMLQRSERYEHMTDGIFSLAVGGVLEQFGYGQSVDKKDIVQQLPRMHEYIDISGHSIRLDTNVRIDLGGIGKAYLIERIAAHLTQNGITAYVINGGGDIVVESVEPVVIEIEHPKKEQLSIASVPLTHGAICTSSPFKRAWKDAQNTPRQHLIHPYSADAEASAFQESATVVAPSAVDADVFATVCAILGSRHFDTIQRQAPLFHADVMLCSVDGEVYSTEFFKNYIH